MKCSFGKCNGACAAGFADCNADAADGRVHFTPANLHTNLHRSLEHRQTKRALDALFPDASRFAVHDALRNVKCPIIELHISNPHQREAFRHLSYVTPVATAMMSGYGAEGYALAIDGMDILLRKARAKA